MKKVLVIDDFAVWQTFLKNLLEINGHTVEVAKDGLDGINRFFTFLPDVVIVDYVMPKLNGVHFTRFVRSFSVFKNVGILMLTGAEETINPFWAKRSGANAFLKKTLPQSDIEREILNFVEKPFSMEWSRELYKLHIEPYGELVDILEESLKESTVVREILQLTSLAYDESLVMKKLYELFSELFEFKNLYIGTICYSEMRLYGFSSGDETRLANSEIILRTLKEAGLNTRFELVETNYTSNRQEIDSHVIELVFKDENLIGFILVEKPKIIEMVHHILTLANYPLTNLLQLLNQYHLLKTLKDVDKQTGTYTLPIIISKILNAIDFAKRNEMPLTFLRIKIKGIRNSSAHYSNQLETLFKLLADTLKTLSPDMVGRINTSEFISVLLGKEKEHVEELLESISRLSQEFSSLGLELLISVSEWNGETVGQILSE
ncbi:response regulator [Fervidobacterium gondwanense]|uniref:Two-component system, cell cycle response regulator n=1 Tax=Fervidobacterium gondwanense DSM 13020 TaxID=1121883 RepID=A0A1M7TE47_FERGO|nr:response regulator [Fervidobacterium gondwanense]SHN68931.1 two-component system, cell cycle response regulator [Fervidobacterium gondwanense DSM 13020]